MKAKNRLLLEKGALGIILLLPLAGLATSALRQDLGANPVETITHTTGLWALRILLLSLALTPLRNLTRWKRAILYRKFLGLMAFFYAVLHFLTYLVFDQQLDFKDTAADIVKRPYITVGFLALVLLTPLAVTSTQRMMKRLGNKRWQQLHKLVYPAAALVILHYLWLVKKDLTNPLVYAFLLGLLFAVRAYDKVRHWRKRKSKEKRA